MIGTKQAIRLFCAVAAAILAFAVTAHAQGVPVEPGKASSAAFEPSSRCGCHAALYEQWATTMHSQALSDPLYLAKVEEANAASDGKLGAFCNKCHGPIATMAKEFDGTMSAVGKEGVTCSFCHQVTGLSGKPANTSHLVASDQVRRAQIKDPDAPHRAAYSAFHRSAEFCGGCHNVDHPINGMHLEATYSEWKASSYAKKGIVCQECHMSRQVGKTGPETGTAAAGGPQRNNIYKMTFIGGNVALGPKDLATERLRASAEVSMTAPQFVAKGASGKVKVTVSNVGAGHYLPTGLTEVREMWLELNATTPEGKTIRVGEVRYGTVLEDAAGKFPVELWEAVAIHSDKRIPPNGSSTETFDFAMPPDVEEADLTATLKYRSAPKELAEKAGVDVPTTDMAAASAVVYSSEEAKAAAEKPSPGKFWDGWNLAVAIIGLVAIFGIVIGFARQSMRG